MINAAMCILIKNLRKPNLSGKSTKKRYLSFTKTKSRISTNKPKIYTHTYLS